MSNETPRLRARRLGLIHELLLGLLRPGGGCRLRASREDPLFGIEMTTEFSDDPRAKHQQYRRVAGEFVRSDLTFKPVQINTQPLVIATKTRDRGRVLRLLRPRWKED